MSRIFRSRILFRALPALMLVVVATACASPRPAAYSGLASSSMLSANSDNSAAKTPYRYAREVNWRRYYKAIIDPVEIYDGPDAQFSKLSSKEQEQLADYMQERFNEELRKLFELTERAGPSTLRIRLTLTGATPTKAILGPLSRFDLAGGAYNAYQGIKGREGTMTGSVIYAVEIYDSADDSLLLAEITKQYPNAMNIGASFGALKAPMAGIERGAIDLREKLTTSHAEK
ncbi:MAG: DUF3313 domain-containing protein [Sphingobium sp.]